MNEDIEKLRKEKTISELLTEWLSVEDRRLCSGGYFTNRDFYNLVMASTGQLDNFIILNNLGGRPFEILVIKDIIGFDNILEAMKGYIYAYKKEGAEKILNKLPT